MVDRTKILVTGADGLVGSRFCELYRERYALLTPSLSELDILNKDQLRHFIETNQPEAIIHLAAYTDVSKAEQERGNESGLCWKINVEGTAHIARIAQEHGIFLIHISTDVVFPATKDEPGPYAEDYKPAVQSDQLSWYGWTKAEAERILSSHTRHAIVRISNPVRKDYEAKKDYIKKIVYLYDEGKLYPMFSDQYLTLTFIDDVAICLSSIIERQEQGIFHVSSADILTPFELASYVLKKARDVDDVVKPISMAEYIEKTGNPARYPQYGGLLTDTTQERLGLEFLTWKQIVDQVI